MNLNSKPCYQLKKRLNLIKKWMQMLVLMYMENFFSFSQLYKKKIKFLK